MTRKEREEAQDAAAERDPDEAARGDDAGAGEASASGEAAAGTEVPDPGAVAEPAPEGAATDGPVEEVVTEERREDPDNPDAE